MNNRNLQILSSVFFLAASILFLAYFFTTNTLIIIGALICLLIAVGISHVLKNRLEKEQEQINNQKGSDQDKS